MFEDNARGYTTWWTMRSSWKTYVKEVGGLMLWDMCTREAAHMHKDMYICMCVGVVICGYGREDACKRVGVRLYVCMWVSVWVGRWVSNRSWVLVYMEGVAVCGEL